MQSLAKPRKITLLGSDLNSYIFLGKPKDDLRKDARLMDFNTIINQLLMTNSDSRRRNLRIRTYGVVTLNEECGCIQWVPNTKPVRHILNSIYETKGVKVWVSKFTGNSDLTLSATITRLPRTLISSPRSRFRQTKRQQRSSEHMFYPRKGLALSLGIKLKCRCL
jgi:phosphatidylinositol kinase/protein kinase (PI-3  family)